MLSTGDLSLPPCPPSPAKCSAIHGSCLHIEGALCFSSRCQKSRGDGRISCGSRYPFLQNTQSTASETLHLQTGTKNFIGALWAHFGILSLFTVTVLLQLVNVRSDYYFIHKKQETENSSVAVTSHLFSICFVYMCVVCLQTAASQLSWLQLCVTLRSEAEYPVNLNNQHNDHENLSNRWLCKKVWTNFTIRRTKVGKLLILLWDKIKTQVNQYMKTSVGILHHMLHFLVNPTHLLFSYLTYAKAKRLVVAHM